MGSKTDSEKEEERLMLKWLDFGLNVANNPSNITIDDVMIPMLQGGYTNRQGEPTTPNAHAPDPAVSFFKIIFVIANVVVFISSVVPAICIPYIMRKENRSIIMWR